MSDVTAVPPAPQRRVRSGHGRIWFVVHGWMALPVWVLLFVVCATGTIATVSHEILWLVDPTVRATAPEGSPRLPLDRIVAAVERAYPDGIVTSVHSREPYLAVEVGVAFHDAPFATAYVNPYTADVQDLIPGPGFAGFMVALHGWLLFPWENGFSLGWYVVTALGFPLLGSLVTGLVVYKRFWRAFYRPRLRLSQGSRTAWGDAHRLIGVWSIWFIAVIAVSGGWFLVTTVLTDLGVEVFPAAPQLASDAVPPAAPGGVPFAPDPEAASRAAVAAIPDMTVRYLRMPESAHGPVTAMGDRGLSLYGPFGNRVFVDPYSGTVIAVQRSEDMATLQAASRMLGALHVGSFGGLWIKLVWFVFGLALSAMILSGIVIWTKRTAQATARLHKSGSGRAVDPSPAAVQ